MALILSYPRSGNTWLRYCIENITKLSTRGYGNNPLDVSIKNKDSNKVVLKRHKITKLENGIPLILILRNYKEVVRGAKVTNLDSFKDLCNGDYKPYDYLQVIKSFDESPSLKKVLYYEDLISKPKESLLEIIDFLGENSEAIKEFIENIKTHKEQSLNHYENNGQKSHTKGDLSIHSNLNKYSIEDRVEIDRYMEECLTQPIFNKYLIRYKEE